MKLQVQLPVLVPVLYGKHRNRIAHVDGTVPLITTVKTVRRIECGDGFDDVTISAHAFIPEERRGEVLPHAHWVDEETLRVNVDVFENRKTLRAFIESGDREWSIG